VQKEDKTGNMITQATPRAFGYRRVSHDDSVKTGLGLDAQKDVIARFSEKLCEELGLTWGGWFTDEAVSALKIPLVDRPAGSKLNAAIQVGDHVIFARMDRAFASPSDLERTTKAWDAEGITVHFAMERYDRSAMGQFQGCIAAGMAQYYRLWIGERTRDAFDQLEKIPGLHRNGRAWMGFRRVEQDGKAVGVEPIPEVRRVMKRIVQMHDDTSNGWNSYSAIGKVVGWSADVCRKAYRVETALVRPAVAAGKLPEC
jgi:DNA invertase Pin-like site-specific DNA recombinase